MSTLSSAQIEALEVDAKDAAVSFKPSIRASLEVVGKILGVVTSVAIPAAIPFLISGRTVAAGAIFGGIQGIGLYAALIGAFGPAIQVLFTTYEIGPNGVKVEFNFLNRNTKSVRFDKITSVEHKRTFWDAILGIERIILSAYGEKGTVVNLVGLQSAGNLRDLLSRRLQEYRQVEHLFADD